MKKPIRSTTQISNAKAHEFNFGTYGIYTMCGLYRVIIKSFPDYKYLLQENHLDMLELYVAPQLEVFQPWIIFQQDGAPPHWGSDVRWFLDATFPDRWIGRDGPTPWPPRSPDFTPFTSFYGGILRTKCFRHHFQILQI